jgi:biofilm PGA synthesis protein PgaD
MLTETPIIAHPEWQSKTQRLTSGTLTLIAWSAWIYLWMPLVSSVLWIAGIQFVYIQVGRSFILDAVWFVMLIALTSCIIVASWASYSYIRFAHKSRRRGTKVIPHDVIGKAFGVCDSDTLSLLSQERRMNLYFDAEGALVRTEALGTQNDEIGNAGLLMASSA